MTIAAPMHRALSTKLAGRSFNVVTRYGYNPWIARVNLHPSDSDAKSSSVYAYPSRAGLLSTRTYATATTKKPAGRPKAHTGRAPAKRPRAATPKKKTGPKTAAGKAKVGRKPKARKVKTKAKPKAKKAPSKTSLLAQRRIKSKELKAAALLGEPKRLPTTSWTVVNSELQLARKASNESLAEVSKAASEKYRNLSPEEKEHYNHVANQNKEKNNVAHKRWLSQFTPEQIREANNARRRLQSERKAANPGKKSVQKYPPIQDDRLVKRPLTSFSYFTKDRHASGDFKGMTIKESAALIGREWKSLSPSERKTYQDRAESDHNRYVEEHTTVYGQAPKTTATAKN